MGHGSGHGSAPCLAHGSAQCSVSFHDDEDDSPVEDVSPVKPKKPSRRAAKAKKDEPKAVKETPKEWTVAEKIALCQGWCDVSENSISENSNNAKGFWEAVISQGRKKSKNSETTSGSTSGGLNLNEEADETVEETQEFRPMGRDRAKAKKKATGSSCWGASSFVDLVADKFYNMKQKNEERRTKNNTVIGIGVTVVIIVTEVVVVESSSVVKLSFVSDIKIHLPSFGSQFEDSILYQKILEFNP
nr:hypothetical protein [Tanacetum cinerariifolium]